MREIERENESGIKREGERKIERERKKERERERERNRNCKVDWVLQPCFGNQSRRKENSEFKPGKLLIKIDLASHPACAEGFGKYILTPI